MSEKKYLSAVIETTLELGCDKKFIEQEHREFTLTLQEDGSFEYVIQKPKYNFRGIIIGYEILEKGNIGFGLARLLKKYSLISDMIERMSKEAYHDVYRDCEQLSAIGFD
jgi:hypothetical protein